ncbi:MAG: hypothetical protein HN470_04810, partial [Nitrosomonadales bacterium]|nr:hypothetical protein [Nitrosomonadales bacterium]
MNNPITIKERLVDLKKLISEHNYHYYVLDNPLISDAEFDKIFLEIKAIEDLNPELITIDSP